MNFYTEKLTLTSFIFLYLKKYLKNISKKNIYIVYYFDASRAGKIIDRFISKFLGIEFQQLKFKMIDIKDENEELVILRIQRKDIFEIQKRIIKSEEFRQLYHPSWKQGRSENFLEKGVVEGDFLDSDFITGSRILYLINVVNWHSKKQVTRACQLMVGEVAWFRIYEEYASNFDIKLITYDDILKFNLKYWIKQLIISPYLYIFLYNLKYRKYNSKIKPTQNKSPKLFLEGRGDVNILNNGHHSDFFWEMNSDFDAKNILYPAHTNEEYLRLSKNKISVTDMVVKYNKNDLTLLCSKSKNFIKERKVIQQQLFVYNSTFNYWYSFFKQYNVKVWLTWYKHSNLHMAVADAISECSGISAIWQMAFEGLPSNACEINADIVFSHSAFSQKIDKQLGSKYTNNIIIGYPKDYAGQKLKKEAAQLRNKLLARGVKKIVFSIDENSSDDSRWHTGHELQRENYSFILEKVLETPWLGVIFKPKVAKNLRRRLGPVNELLDEVIKSGRCILLEESGRHATISPPLLAGLASDVCIHGHLSAGTAALECALEGTPTLLIDREGCHESKLYELPKDKVIFKNWEEAINVLMEHLQTPNGIPGFGDWSSIIDELDPFRDGKSAQRMGNYLNWLIQGFEKGMDKEVIMSDAAERYGKEWGYDKVITNCHKKLDLLNT